MGERRGRRRRGMDRHEEGEGLIGEEEGERVEGDERQIEPVSNSLEDICHEIQGLIEQIAVRLMQFNNSEHLAVLSAHVDRMRGMVNEFQMIEEAEQVRRFEEGESE